ncbi:RNA polymerase factor sigma-54 [Ruminiclostridium papyrosolvens]|uniref:RNA polymerase subunit sigma-54 n=1 Tax=Ruminiclostridium papyrosolvens C7 TaxID=1330534 RepID=U4R330_9FIRM|nr:RNA polymerase factor sigma-54 [Ruminiclostridium papyrosolvens]EPR12855.1 RNA polymerase subunit sigma-54 [Ruminiclostridium papyrosolvens C7]
MNIEINLTQKMSLSPQMQQSMEVLQMSTQELMDYVKQLAVDNPVVELEDQPYENDRNEVLRKKLEWLDSVNQEYRVYNHDYEDDEDNKDVAHYVAGDDEDLYQHLKSQLNLMKEPPEIYKAVQYMIGCIDQNGYLQEKIDDIVKAVKIDKNKTETALHQLQSMEPAGVGARNLKECLLLQLERLNQNDPIVITLVNSYLELLGKNQLDLIAKRLDVSIDKVKDAYKVIKKLNPRPGMGFGARKDIHYQTPDLIVVKFSDYYEVLLNNFSTPHISISSYYRNVLAQNPSDEVKNYISGKIKEADWAIKCISQRNNTLLNVIRTIVGQQRGFFDKGASHLIPMNQKSIADKLEIHESTVSRAIRGKYLQCSWGVFSLDYFFTNGLSLGCDSQIVPDAIKSDIKQIITGEDRKKPYSDQKIAEILNQKGISIARRTVTKYREDMDIPKATMRKEY